jgi:outer membrane protein TolC
LEAVEITQSETPIPGFLSLEEILDMGASGNFDMRDAQAELARATGIRVEQRARVLPQLGAGASISEVDPDSIPNFGESSFGSTRGWIGSVELEQPLFLGFEGVARVRQGTKTEQAAYFGLASVANNTLFEVRRAFFDILLNRARVDVRLASVQLLEEQLEIERNKFEAGTVPEFNVLRAEVEVANAQSPLIRTRNELRNSLEDLSELVGFVNPEAARIEVPFRIAGQLQFREPVLDVPAALEAALQTRPEIRQLELLRDLEADGVIIEQSEFYPKLFAVAGYSWESSRFGNDLQDIDQGWNIGARTTWNLFDGMRTYGRIAQARARLSSARVRLEQALKGVEIEVRQAVSDLFEARQLVLASRRVVERAEEGLRQARARLDAGSGLQIDVLDTQVALTEARTNQIEALHAFEVAKASLERATGESAQAFLDRGVQDQRK